MLSQIENAIEIAVFDAGEEWVMLDEKNGAVLPSEIHDFNDEVMKAQERDFPKDY